MILTNTHFPKYDIETHDVNLGSIRVAQAVPGVVPADLPLHPGVPEPPLRPHPLHRGGHPPNQRAPLLRHHSTLGGYRQEF